MRKDAYQHTQIHKADTQTMSSNPSLRTQKITYPIIILIVQLVSELVTSSQKQEQLASQKAILFCTVSTSIVGILLFGVLKYLNQPLLKCKSEYRLIVELVIFSLFAAFGGWTLYKNLEEIKDRELLATLVIKVGIILVVVFNALTMFAFRLIGMGIYLLIFLIYVFENEQYYTLTCCVDILACLFIAISFYSLKEKQNRFDISQLKQKERELKFLQFVGNNSNDATLILSDKKSVVYYNLQFSSVLQCIQQQAKKQPSSSSTSTYKNLNDLQQFQNIFIDEYNLFQEDPSPSVPASSVKSIGTFTFIGISNLQNLKEVMEKILMQLTLDCQRDTSSEILVADEVEKSERKIKYNHLYKLKGWYKDPSKQREKSEIEISFSFKKSIDYGPLAVFSFCKQSDDDDEDEAKILNQVEVKEYKNSLLASVSHELRTPLNGIINFLGMSIEESSISQQFKKQYLQPSLRSAKYLLTIIDDILDLSQIQQGTLKLQLETRDLIKTTEEAISLLELQAQKKKISLNLELPTQDWNTKVKTDHSRLRQILTNLLSNAVKFTFQGNVTVKITEIQEENEQASSSNKKQYKFSVIDTGIGISKVDQQRVIDTFRRVDMQRRNSIKTQGTGLGLTIANALSILLNPETNSQIKKGLGLKSIPQKGSTFSFIIGDIEQEEEINNNNNTNSNNYLCVNYKNSLVESSSQNKRQQLFLNPQGKIAGFTRFHNNLNETIESSQRTLNFEDGGQEVKRNTQLQNDEDADSCSKTQLISTDATTDRKSTIFSSGYLKSELKMKAKGTSVESSSRNLTPISIQRQSSSLIKSSAAKEKEQSQSPIVSYVTNLDETITKNRTRSSSDVAVGAYTVTTVKKPNMSKPPQNEQDKEDQQFPPFTTMQNYPTEQDISSPSKKFQLCKKINFEINGDPSSPMGTSFCHSPAQSPINQRRTLKASTLKDYYQQNKKPQNDNLESGNKSKIELFNQDNNVALNENKMNNIQQDCNDDCVEKNQRSSDRRASQLLCQPQMRMLGTTKKQLSSRRITKKPNLPTNEDQINLTITQIDICKCPEVLIVDDDSFNIIALENILGSLGYSVESCFNGQEALEAVYERGANSNCKSCVGYKIIFLDCNMPIMDGYNCAKKIKQHFADKPTMACPIVACTAFVSESDKQKAYQAGMDDYLIKPISKDKIAQCLGLHAVTPDISPSNQKK